MKSKQEITINDIAKQLNIAPSTVSRALNNHPRISEATKEKVRKVASELGYELNLVASSLSKQKTNIIGVVVPSISSLFFAKALSGIQEVAQAAGYNVIIGQTNESYEQEVEAVKVMNSARVDGLVVCSAMETHDISHFDSLIKKEIPIAMFDRVHFDVPGPKVIVDNYEAAYKATEHLINVGCKRIAHLAGNSSCKVFGDRVNGFKEALNTNDLQLYPQYLLSSDLSEKDTREAMQVWMNLEDKPDGIVTASASSGLIMASLAKTYSIKVPEDLAVISLGSERCNELMVPSVSAIDMPGEEMGKTAVQSLLKCLKKKQVKNSMVLKNIQLVIRNSTFNKLKK